MKKSLSFISFAIFFSMTAHAEVVQVIANADTQIEADQTSLLLGTMGEDGSVARCEMKFDAKTYARTLSKGDVFLIDTKSFKNYKIDPKSRAEMAYQFSQLAGGGLELPKEVVTFEQFKAYVKEFSGGGVEVTNWPTQPIPILELLLVSKSTQNAYKVVCRHKVSPSLTIDQVVGMMETEGVFKPSPQL